MAFPALVTSFVGSTTSNGTTHNITVASGIISGQLLLVFVSADGAPDITTSTSGWTRDGVAQSFNSAVAQAKFYKIADGSESGSTLAITTSANERISWVGLVIQSWQGSAPNTGFTITGGGSTGTDANPDPASITGGSTNDDYLFVACYSVDSNKTTSSYPTGYTTIQLSQSEGSTNGSGVGVAAKQITGSSVVDNPGTYTISGADDWMTTAGWIRGGTSGDPPAAAGYPYVGGGYYPS